MRGQPETPAIVTIEPITERIASASWRPGDRFAVIEQASGVIRCCRTLDQALELQAGLIEMLSRPPESSRWDTSGEW